MDKCNRCGIICEGELCEKCSVAPDHSKDRCCSCGKKMKNWQTRYWAYGNYCSNCSAKCDLIVSIRKMLSRPEKNKTKIEETLRKLKRYGIDLEYIKQTQKYINVIKEKFN